LIIVKARIICTVAKACFSLEELLVYSATFILDNNSTEFA